MTVIQCDQCSKTIPKIESRFIGTIQLLSFSTSGSKFIKNLIITDMDFCSIECLYRYVEIKLRSNE